MRIVHSIYMGREAYERPRQVACLLKVGVNMVVYLIFVKSLPSRDVLHFRLTKCARLGNFTNTSVFYNLALLVHDIRQHLF